MAKIITNKRLKEILNNFSDDAHIMIFCEDLFNEYDDGIRNIDRVIVEYVEEDEFNVPTITMKTN